MSQNKISRREALAAIGAAGTAFAFGCGSDSPTAPTGDGPIGATITITASGVSPKSVTVSPGSRVTFTNNDSIAHDMNSDPHPEHTDCPEINDVGTLNPGQSRQTGNMNTVRTCGYHDHNQDTVVSLQGTITIQ